MAIFYHPPRLNQVTTHHYLATKSRVATRVSNVVQLPGDNHEAEIPSAVVKLDRRGRVA